MRPGPHGGDGRRLARELGMDPASVLDLSASLCPVAPDPVPVLRRHLGAIGHYPDPLPATAALAEAMGVEPRHLLLTNGGAEAISLVASALGGQVVEPEFSSYPRGGGPLWRSNPNNPLGTLAPAAASAGVWDEAFWPLATGTWTRGDYRQGAVVVGSLTKLLACPGLRLGYVLCADEALVDRLAASQPEWSVNGLAAEALSDLLALVDLATWSRETAALRDRLASLLCFLGRSVRAASGPWVLVENAGPLRSQLLAQGIVVRDCASFGLHDTVRIALPRAEDFARLEKALGRLGPNGAGDPGGGRP
jgi:histidinol-phosphate/aromatic aminotransferase/cobyric acid decarboxylase-like protein